MAGQIKANQLQLGDSTTATQNFTLQTNVDGTAKLARGNVGETTQDILTVDAAGKVSAPQGFGSANSLPVFQCRAWGNFNGAGTPAFRASGNMNPGITDGGAGTYSVTFASAMPDANYSVIATCSGDGSGANIPGSVSITSQSTTGFSLIVRDSASGAVDRSIICFGVFL